MPQRDQGIVTNAKVVHPIGLLPNEALKSITLYPAQIVGVRDRLGPLEPVKEATLMITKGNPLEVTMNVQHAFMQGRKIDLNNRHKQLRERYRKEMDHSF